MPQIIHPNLNWLISNTLIYRVTNYCKLPTGMYVADTWYPNRFNYDNVNFSINSDDPSIMRKTLIDDYKMCSELGLSYKQIKQSVSMCEAYNDMCIYSSYSASSLIITILPCLLAWKQFSVKVNIFCGARAHRVAQFTYTVGPPLSKYSNRTHTIEHTLGVKIL